MVFPTAKCHENQKNDLPNGQVPRVDTDGSSIAMVNGSFFCCRKPLSRTCRRARGHAGPLLKDPHLLSAKKVWLPQCHREGRCVPLLGVDHYLR